MHRAIGLLPLAATFMALTGCSGGLPSGGRPKPPPLPTVMFNRITNQKLSTIRDTIIRNSVSGDTLITHVVYPDSCWKVPRPPDCPPLLEARSTDTIIR